MKSVKLRDTKLTPYWPVCMLIAQLCQTLCDPMDYNLPGSSIHGILQVRIIEWVAHSLLQGIFPTHGLNLGLLHCSEGRFLTVWATREALRCIKMSLVTLMLFTRDISIFTYIPSCLPLVLVSVKIPQSIKFKVLKNFLLRRLPWLANGCWLPVSSHDFPVCVLISYKDHQPYWIRAHPSDLL